MGDAAVSRIRSVSIAPLLGIWTLSLGSLLAAQVAGGVAGGIPGQPPRDLGAQLPTERRIPVGTSAITGTVQAADTGRPVAGARVTVSGQAKVDTAAATAGVAPQPGQQAGAASTPQQLQVRFVGSAQAPPISAAASVSRTVMTDASGAFTFPRLPAGTFTVSVYQNQFLNVSYGQTRYGGQGKTITLADGQQATVKVTMPRGAAITGMIIGPDGDPIRNAQIRAWRVDISSGFKRLQNTSAAQSDDRGVYRLFGLIPGEYYISATPNTDLAMASPMSAQYDLVERAIASGPVLPPAAPGMTPTVSVPLPQPSGPAAVELSIPGYLPTYAPSSMLPSGGTPVTVAAGEEKVGIDVRAQITQATTIKGTLTTPLDPGVTVQLSLVSEETSIDSPPSMTARADQNGTFTFRSVGPGTYSVVAQTTPAPPTITIVNGQATPVTQSTPALSDAQKMWGRTRLTIAGEPTIPVSVALKPSLTISGIVNLEMEKGIDLGRTRVMVGLSQAPAPQTSFLGALPQAPVGPDGRFTLTGVMPGRYTVRVTNGSLKSAMIAGQDILDFPLEFSGDRNVTDAVLTMTDQVSELSGSLLDSAGKPVEGFTILAVATDNRFWRPGSRRIALGRPGPDGQYTIRNLPPGTYQLAAVIDLEQGAQYDPEFLRSLARLSVPVTISGSGKVTQDLRVK